MNFFEPNCQEQSIRHQLFGICDDQNGKKAYTDVFDPKKWIAKVKNDKGIELVFTAVDKCVIKDDEEIGRGRCDGILNSENHIYFIELKDEARSWKVDAIDQLESTIKFFMDYHDIKIFKYKKAFACNKQHRHFQEIDNETNLRFFRTYGVRIDAQTDIIIV